MKKSIKLCAMLVSALLVLSCFGGCGKKPTDPEKPDAAAIIESDDNSNADGIVADDAALDDHSVEVDFDTGETKPAPPKKTTTAGQTTATTKAGEPTADTTTGSSAATTTADSGTTTGTTKDPNVDDMGHTGEWSPWQG